MTAANSKHHRKALIQTAIWLFRRQGYAATGLNEILKISKAPKGSLYYYFPGGKEELAVAAIKAASNTVLDTLERLEDISTSAEDFLGQYCTMLAGWIEKSNFADGCPISTTLLEMGAKSDAIAEAGLKGFQSWKTVIRRVIERDGILAKDAENQATLIMSCLQGAMLMARVERSTNALKQLPVLARK